MPESGGSRPDQRHGHGPEHGRGLVVSIQQDAPIPLHVDFTCAGNEVLAVFGPSGSGKTTLLRTIAGLSSMQRGRVACGGVTWTDTTQGQHTPTYRRRLGFVFQDYALFPHLSALHNVTAALHDRSRRARAEAARQWLSAVHLSGVESRRPSHLSGGERQRVAIARAVVREPSVLLLDEPFAAVDRAVREQLHRELIELRRRLQVPIVLVTHDFHDVVRLATHVLLLDRGHTVAQGSIEALSSSASVPWARHGIDAGSVFDAQVTAVDAARGLASLSSAIGELLVPCDGLAIGDRVRVRIAAREIILATAPPEGLSLHNVLPARVTDLTRADPHVIVQMMSGQGTLLAEVTSDAVERLPIERGRKVFALIKSVSIDVHAGHM